DALVEKEVPAQANFDKLLSSSLMDAARQKRKSAPLGQMEAAEEQKKVFKRDERRLARKEQAVLPAPSVMPLARQSLDESLAASANEGDTKQRLRITTFESEIDPLEMSLLDSGQFVLFRKVWRNGERQIQGMLLDRQAFIWNIVRSAIFATALANTTDLTIMYRGENLGTLNGRTDRYPLSSARDLKGQLLYQTSMSAPLGELELIFRITRLPLGPGTQVLVAVSIFAAVMLVVGFYQMYRLGMAQIRLARQQQDFISAVSHELKTPLTSIRMYGEMLREGWVSEEKKRRYYDYIFDESERLSRLINNVLQLARMTRSEMPINAREISLAECMELIRAKVGVQIERAGFEPVFHSVVPVETRLKIDPDHLTQIMINLVDNGIKFSAKQTNKRIEISCDALRDKTAVFGVRDYGPGIPNDQMKKIFKLFYRSENELTRETVGTGIGLALVHQLAVTMGGRVDVINKQPGAEFRVYFPTLSR
ncbi:MAG: sensor histidine kinase, partial [Gammaproteobacteria bacterium]